VPSIELWVRFCIGSNLDGLDPPMVYDTWVMQIADSTIVVMNMCSENTLYIHWLIISTVSFYRYMPILYFYALFFLLTFSSVYPSFTLEL
jgi:hypothetical protein